MIELALALSLVGSAPDGPGEPVDPARPLRPHEIRPEVYFDRSGAPELYVHSAINGALMATLITRAAFAGADSTRAASGAFIGAGLGVLLPALLTEGRPLPAGEGAYYAFGQRWGIVNGLLVPLLWGDDGDPARAVAVGAASLGGVLATTLSYERLRPAPGQVSAIGSAHTFGTIAGALLMLVYDVVPDSGAAFAAPLLIVSNGSLVGAVALREYFDVDRRRVIMMDVGGYLGIAAGLGVGFLIAGADDFPRREQLFGGTMLAGMAGGLAAGLLLSSGYDQYEDGVLGPTWESWEGTTGIVDSIRFVTPRIFDSRAAGARRTVGLGLNLVEGRW